MQAVACPIYTAGLQRSQCLNFNNHSSDNEKNLYGHAMVKNFLMGLKASY